MGPPLVCRSDEPDDLDAEEEQFERPTHEADDFAPQPVAGGASSHQAGDYDAPPIYASQSMGFSDDETMMARQFFASPSL